MSSSDRAMSYLFRLNTSVSSFKDLAGAADDFSQWVSHGLYQSSPANIGSVDLQGCCKAEGVVECCGLRQNDFMTYHLALEEFDDVFDRDLSCEEPFL